MEINGAVAANGAVEGGGAAAAVFQMDGLRKCLSSYIDDGSPETHRYFLARKTVLEMLKDRGYYVPASDISVSLQEFRSIHDQNIDVERLKFSATHQTDPSNTIADLLVNITKHVLKPRHQVLPDEEKKQLLKQYSIEDKQLPRLLRNDAIARYYGLEKGQVVKVTYTGDITDSHVTYRCVW
ncbi:DNA-directed RNA polymerase V subunit 5A [Linum perenne]